MSVHDELFDAEKALKSLRDRARKEDDKSAMARALNDCYKSLSLLPDVDGAYRLTCMEQAKEALIKAGYVLNQ